MSLVKRLFRGLPGEEVEELWQVPLALGGEGRLSIGLFVEEKLAAYCWPGREFVLSHAAARFKVDRGYFFPLSFMTFVYQSYGYTFVLETDFQRIGFYKDETGMRLELTYGPEVEEARIRVYRHQPDWHDGLCLYRAWCREHLPMIRSRALKGHFHIKRYFFHQELCRHHVFTADGSCRLLQQWQEDQQLAGVDTLLLFDHAFQTEGQIRCGNRSPLAGFSDLDGYLSQAGKLREHGALLFAYFDPYLLDGNSDLACRYGEKLAIKNASGRTFHNWRIEDWHPCLSDKEWQRESAAYVKEAVKGLQADGVYFDEIGNGTQYICHDSQHGHPRFRQVAAESRYTAHCLAAVPGSLAMSEFPMVDRMAVDFDGVLNDTASALDIYRFALPEMKCFRMVNCDYPLGNAPQAVNQAFFNGEGLWLDNDLRDQEWYPSEILERIKAQYQVLKGYEAYFEAEETRPLSEGSTESVWVNRFGCVDDCVYTALNVTQAEQIVLMPCNGMAVEPIYRGPGCRIERQAERIWIRLMPGEVCAFRSEWRAL